MGPFPNLPQSKYPDERTPQTDAATSAALRLHQRYISGHPERSGAPRMGYTCAVPVQVLERYRRLRPSRSCKRVVLVHDSRGERADLGILRSLHCIGRPVSTSVAHVDRGTRSEEHTSE